MMNPHTLLSATPRLTAEEYDEAIADLERAKTQLDPDGRGCVVCGDGSHQAWECHHNPVALKREFWRLRSCWRCFHCDEVFTTEESAREHFGEDPDEPAACQRGPAEFSTGGEPDGDE